ncbi:DUF3450 domain-containing protein [Celerinatantimonas diazotrophica]|nr:DUF3450 domain-containing protein [Celerinatantimonas diazotrophica]
MIIAAALSRAVLADTLSTAQDKVVQTHQQDANVQVKLNNLDKKTREALNHYQQNQRQADLIEAYNRQLQKMIDSQEQEKQRIHSQLGSLNETEQSALPMLVSMYQQLATFVSHDQPFLKQERQQRLARLKKIIDRADVSLAEKYRQVLDAYQVEIAYAKSIGSYQGELKQGNKTIEVNFFRLGRTALYYQTLNGDKGALWQPASQQWQPLNESQNKQLSIAIAMANKQHIPQLLKLPMPREAKR